MISQFEIMKNKVEILREMIKSTQGQRAAAQKEWENIFELDEINFRVVVQLVQAYGNQAISEIQSQNIDLANAFKVYTENMLSYISESRKSSFAAKDKLQGKIMGFEEMEAKLEQDVLLLQKKIDDVEELAEKDRKGEDLKTKRKSGERPDPIKTERLYSEHKQLEAEREPQDD